MEKNQEYKTFGTHVGYVIAANIAILLVNLFQLPILTKSLGATLYGTWSLIDVTISLIVPFALLGLNMSIVLFLAAEKDTSRIREDFISACSIVFIWGTILSILLFCLSDYLAVYIFKDTNASYYIKLASILVLLNSIHMLPLAFFRMQRKIGLYAILTLVYQVFQVGLILASTLLGYELTGVIIALILNAILFNSITLLIILRQIGFHAPGFSNIRSYLRWGIPLMPNTAMLWIIQTSDRYMVSYFMGVDAAGIYSAAYTIGDYAPFVLVPLGTVLFPSISKYYNEGNLGKTKNYLKYSVKYLMAIAIPSAFGLSILAKPLLEILCTPAFIVGSNVVAVVAFGAVLRSFYQFYVYVIQLVGRTYITVWLLAIAATLNIVLNIVFIPTMGMLGAAFATFIAYGVQGMLGLLVTRRYLNFDLSLPFIGKSVVSAGIMTLCIWLLNPQSILMVILSILLGAFIYFSILYAIKGFSKGEITFFASLVRGNLRKLGLIKE